MPPNGMKRHLISDVILDKDDLKHCSKTNLAILGDCRSLVGEDRDASESEHRDSKRPKLQPQQEQAKPTKIECDDQTNKANKLRFMNLVSTAVTLICDDRKQSEQPEREQSQEDQSQRDQGVSSSSEVSMASTIQKSRSDSVSSEPSIYRSYEMEIPDQIYPELNKKGRLPRAPRLATVNDFPTTKEIGCQLNTRRYGERQDVSEGEKIQMIESNVSNPIPFHTVIYH